MKIATFNANSIRARIEIVIDWLKREKPDLLCIQETKVQDKDFPVKRFRELDYHVTFSGQKSYNGVAIISKSPLEEIRPDLYRDGDEQARFISARVLNIPVVNVYVPQGFSPGTEKFIYKLNWLEDLLSHIKGEYDPGLPLMIVGDFNVALEHVDLYDPEGMKGEAGFHPDEQASMRKFFEWGVVDIFRKNNPEGGHYTFWDYRIPNGFKRNLGWRIDYILTTRPLAEKCKKVWIDTEPRGRERPSDHTFLIAEFDI